MLCRNCKNFLFYVFSICLPVFLSPFGSCQSEFVKEGQISINYCRQSALSCPKILGQQQRRGPNLKSLAHAQMGTILGHLLVLPFCGLSSIYLLAKSLTHAITALHAGFGFGITSMVKFHFCKAKSFFFLLRFVLSIQNFMFQSEHFH